MPGARVHTLDTMATEKPAAVAATDKPAAVSPLASLIASIAEEGVAASLDGSCVKITYASLAEYNARCSLDVEAVRACKGVAKILRSEVSHPQQASAMGPHVLTIVCG